MWAYSYIITNGIVFVEIEGRKYDLAVCHCPTARHSRKNGSEEAEANAKRIVTAVNNFDELKEALAACVLSMEQATLYKHSSYKTAAILLGKLSNQ